MNRFGSPHRVPAAGAKIFSGAALLRRKVLPSWAVGARAGDRNSMVFISSDENVCQAVFQNEVQQIIAGSGEGPAIFRVMLDNQSMGFRFSLKPLVVIGSPSGSVLDAMYIAVQVDHLMEQCGADILNGSCQGPSADIDLMGTAIGRNPGILSQGEMAVCSGSALDGDGRS